MVSHNSLRALTESPAQPSLGENRWCTVARGVPALQRSADGIVRGRETTLDDVKLVAQAILSDGDLP